MEEKIVANNGNIKQIVKSEIERLGNEADLNHIDVSGVTNMEGLFRGLDFVGNISNWDVGNVKYMSWMFYNSSFNQDISNWDVGNVRNMRWMFQYSKFNQDISKWDVGNVRDMSWMFAGSQFNQDISKWDVGNVENMNWMFRNSKFNGDISKWDVGNVVDMWGMFFNSKFKQDINMWNYNFKLVEEKPSYFKLYTTGSYTLIEKYVKALQSKKFDLAEKIKFKMKGIRFNYRYKDIEESKHLVTIEDNILKEFKEYLRK